jgi:hypothetical protein
MHITSVRLQASYMTWVSGFIFNFDLNLVLCRQLNPYVLSFDIVLHSVLSRSTKTRYVSCVPMSCALSSPLITDYLSPNSAVNGALIDLPVCRWMWSCRKHFTIERLLNDCNICFNHDISFMPLCSLWTVCELCQSVESQYIYIYIYIFICCR